MRVGRTREPHPGGGRFDYHFCRFLLPAHSFKFFELSRRCLGLEPPPGPAEEFIGLHLARQPALVEDNYLITKSLHLIKVVRR